MQQRLLDFWNYVNKNGPIQPHCPELGPCWQWTAGVFKSGGYGLFGINGEMRRCHRVSWIISHGSIQDGVQILHKCDNPRCVNPAHLFAGTPNDNMQDMIVKGRSVHAKGDHHPCAQLTLRSACEIKTLAQRGWATKAMLARMYAQSRTNIGRIVNGRLWKDAPILASDDAVVLKLADRFSSGEFSRKRGGYASLGEHHGMAKLTEDIVRQIRARYARGNVKLLADEFGVAIGTVRDIYYRRRWKHVV